jgi:hypothetical protein
MNLIPRSRVWIAPMADPTNPATHLNTAVAAEPAVTHALPAEGGAPPLPTADLLQLLRPTPIALPANDWPTVPGYTLHRELGRGGMGVVYLVS